MPIRNRTITVITGAAVGTALAGAAAFAAVPHTSDAITMRGMSAHMAGLDEDALAEMHSMMVDGASVGSMHRWMRDNDIDLGQMHGDMARAGMNHGSMHRSMASAAR